MKKELLQTNIAGIELEELEKEDTFRDPSWCIHVKEGYAGLKLLDGKGLDSYSKVFGFDNKEANGHKYFLIDEYIKDKFGEEGGGFVYHIIKDDKVISTLSDAYCYDKKGKVIVPAGEQARHNLDLLNSIKELVLNSKNKEEAKAILEICDFSDFVDGAKYNVLRTWDSDLLPYITEDYCFEPTYFVRNNDKDIDIECEDWDVKSDLFRGDSFFGFRVSEDCTDISTTLNCKMYLNKYKKNLEKLDEEVLELLGEDFKCYKDELLDLTFYLSIDFDKSKVYLSAYRDEEQVFDKEVCDIELDKYTCIDYVMFTNEEFIISINGTESRVSII